MCRNRRYSDYPLDQRQKLDSIASVLKNPSYNGKSIRFATELTLGASVTHSAPVSASLQLVDKRET
jgi:hypothetical protein